MKIVPSLKDSNDLLKAITKTIGNQTKQLKKGFLGMLLGTFGASLFGNLLTEKGIVRAWSSRPLSSTWQNKKGKKIVRAGFNQKCNDKEPRFKSVFF